MSESTINEQQFMKATKSVYFNNISNTKINDGEVLYNNDFIKYIISIYNDNNEKNAKTSKIRHYMNNITLESINAKKIFLGNVFDSDINIDRGKVLYNIFNNKNLIEKAIYKNTTLKNFLEKEKQIYSKIIEIFTKIKNELLISNDPSFAENSFEQQIYSKIVERGSDRYDYIDYIKSDEVQNLVYYFMKYTSDFDLIDIFNSIENDVIKKIEEEKKENELQQPLINKNTSNLDQNNAVENKDQKEKIDKEVVGNMPGEDKEIRGENDKEINIEDMPKGDEDIKEEKEIEKNGEKKENENEIKVEDMPEKDENIKEEEEIEKNGEKKENENEINIEDIPEKDEDIKEEEEIGNDGEKRENENKINIEYMPEKDEDIKEEEEIGNDGEKRENENKINIKIIEGKNGKEIIKKGCGDSFLDKLHGCHFNFKYNEVEYICDYNPNSKTNHITISKKESKKINGTSKRGENTPLSNDDVGIDENELLRALKEKLKDKKLSSKLEDKNSLEDFLNTYFKNSKGKTR